MANFKGSVRAEKKLPFFVDLFEVHKKWSIFCFYGKFWIVFEIIVYKVNDLKFFVLQRKHVPDNFFPESIKSVYGEENNSKSEHIENI